MDQELKDGLMKSMSEPAKAKRQCEFCNDTGYVKSNTAEYEGYCPENCVASQNLKAYDERCRNWKGTENVHYAELKDFPELLNESMECAECGYEDSPDVIQGHLIQVHEYTTEQAKRIMDHWIESMTDDNGHVRPSFVDDDSIWECPMEK